RQQLLLRGGDEMLVYRVRGEQADQVAAEDRQHADVEAVAADPHALVRQQLAGAGAPAVHGLVVARPAADQQYRRGSARVALVCELVAVVVHGCSSGSGCRAAERRGGAQSCSSVWLPMRTASPPHTRSMVSVVSSRASSLARWRSIARLSL